MADPHRGGAARRGGYRCVVFDCDSTLVAMEGIDELAGPHMEEVRALTDLAMHGEVPLEEVYGRRLEIISPSREEVEAIGSAYVRTLVAGARGTVASLMAAGVDVRVISGGLLPPVLAVARELGVPDHHVAAVDVQFDPRGRYAGFDTTSPLARSGGKRDVIRLWSVPRPALMVGDGATDLEARPAVDAFVAFMGVAHRPGVAAAADFVVHGPSLAPVLEIALGDSFGERSHPPASRSGP